MNTPFPIEVFDPATINTKPDNIKYLLSREAIFTVRPLHFGHIAFPADVIEGLPTVKPESTFYLDMPKIPAALLGQVWDFFAEVFIQYKAEAMVFLTYHPDDGYKAFIPQQTTTGTSVNADFNLEHIAKGHRIVGTVHSHCDFDAFHSGTDQDDARQSDGLHMTIGHVNTPNPSTAVMISANKRLFDFELKDVVEGDLERIQAPAWWHRYVNDPKRVVSAPKTKISHHPPAQTNGHASSSSPTPFRGNRYCDTHPSGCTGNLATCKNVMTGASTATTTTAAITAPARSGRGSEDQGSRRLNYDPNGSPDADWTCIMCGGELSSASKLYCQKCVVGNRNRKPTKTDLKQARDKILDAAISAPEPLKMGGNAELLETFVDHIIRSGEVPPELSDSSLYEIGMAYVAERLTDVEDILNICGISVDITYSWSGRKVDVDKAITALYAAIYSELPF